jgi:Triose-phosphate Transporter family
MSELQAPFNARFGQLFSRGSSYNWLLAYFFFNLALTIYNKVVLNGNFPFPYTLTAVHAFCGAVGSWLCLEQNIFSMPQLKKRESIQIILFSVLYTINIVTSNVSLYVLCLSYRANCRHLVTVPFHQIVRSTTPLFVIAISVSLFGKSYTSQTYLSLIPVCSTVIDSKTRS